jgi:hypothetical protein
MCVCAADDGWRGWSQENKAAAAAMAAAQELAAEAAEEAARQAATPVPLQGGALRAHVAAERRSKNHASKLKQYRFNRALHERLQLRVQVSNHVSL